MKISTLLIQYYLTAFFFIIYIIYKFNKDRELNAINIVRSMYILVYTIAPIITLTHVSNNGLDSKTLTLSLSSEGLIELSEMGFFSIIGFIGLELGYACRARISIGHVHDKRRVYDNRAIWKASVAMTLISLIALFLWTYPFGGPIAMFQYGTLIRSGREIEGISNTFGFMKQFVPLAQFATIASLALFNRERKPKYMINLIVSTVISIVYLIANDGRAAFLMYIVSILILLFILRDREKTHSGFHVLSYIVVGIIGFLFITNIYTIIGLFTGTINQESTSGISITGFIYDEFSWTVRNAQAVRDGIRDGYTFKFFNEFLSGVLAWIPSRFRPAWLPRLEKVNTQYWYGSSRIFGGKPPDIITAGLYTLWYPGVFLLPFIWGYIIKQISRFFDNRDDSIYFDIIFVQMIYQFSKIIPYDDFALIMLNFFYIFIGHLLVLFFNRRYSN